MAKVGLENDTLNPPKCPSNWEYSTGQRQLLDIQSREQMDRLSFSAPRMKVSEFSETFFVVYTSHEKWARRHSDKVFALPTEQFQRSELVQVIR